jgi:ribonuclease T
MRSHADSKGRSEIYFSVDIEASGPIPGIYSMLSLGACTIEDTETTFYRELKPLTANYVPEALEVNKFSLKKLREEGQRPKLAISDFKSWIERHSTGCVPVFVGFNASFDWQFVNWYFHSYLGANPFGIAALDIKAYYMGREGCRWSDTKASQITAKYKSDFPQTHNALEDARAQASIFRKLISIK